MRWLTNRRGFTIVEIIMSIAVIGIIIAPLMGMFVMSSKINQESSKEFKSFLEAQKYMEEIKAMDSIDVSRYPYNSITGAYEGTVIQTEDKLGAQVMIIPKSGILYNIEINIIDEGKVVNSLRGSRIFY